MQEDLFSRLLGSEEERRDNTLIIGHVESFQKGVVKSIKCYREGKSDTEKCPFLT